MTQQRPSMRMGVIITLALRNIRRNVRRTILTATALIIGGAMLIFSLLLGDGRTSSGSIPA